MKIQLRHITHGSRLIIIYLITLLVSGGIMVYLGIQNISNFTELTEKRILEEEKDIHSRYRASFQKSLEKLTVDLQHDITKDTIFGIVKWKQSKHALVSDYMIMAKDGALIHPRFSSQRFTHSITPTSSAFNQLFEDGERLEFLGNDFKASQKRFLAALQQASSALDSVKVFNAVSRLEIKMNNPETACDYFAIIIADFGAICNNFGLPYPYFSVDHLLKLESSILNKKKGELLKLFLENLNAGAIPFTQNTQIVLGQINEYLKSSADSIVNSALSEQLKMAFRTSEQIRNYLPFLSDLMNDLGNTSSTTLNDFVTLDSQNGSEELFLVSTQRERLYGFIVPLSAVAQQVTDVLSLELFSFTYDINLTESTPGIESQDADYEFSDSFSPFFAGYSLVIRVSDEKQVSDFIFQRKLITMIGLGLLLAAMIIGFFMLVQDFGRKRKTERLRADFVANVTHELKTPLTSINMFADSIVLERVKNEKELKKYATIIVKESEKLKRMINNILDFSRKESDKLKLNFREENISSVVEEIMDEMNYWLEINGFDVSLNLDPSIIAVIDKEGIKQVLSNLLTNAIKYSPEEKSVRINTYKRNNTVQIEVTDKGIGIPEDKLPNIFEKFYRVFTKDNESISGTGLGLTVSKAIVEEHGGKLTVRSKIDEGSTFTIELNCT